MLTAIKKITSVLVLIITTTILVSASAQSQQRMRMSVEDQVKILKDSLKLSDNQVAKITKILEDQREERTTAMDENKGDRKAMRTAMQEIMKKTNEKIKEVLTEDQAAKYDRMMKSHRSQMNRRSQRGSE